MMEILKEYVERFPTDALSISNCEYGGVGRMLNKGEADIGLVMDTELRGEESDFARLPVEQCRMIAIVSPQHKFADRKSIKMSEMMQERVYFCKPDIMERVSSRPDIEEYLDMFSFGVPVPSDDTLVFMVRANQGIGVLPEPIARYYFSDMVFLDFEDVESSFDILLTWRKDNTNPALRHFMTILSEHNLLQ